MKILITGVAGFIGSHLADRFLKDGHDVTGLDNLLTGRIENIVHNIGRKNFSFVKADISETIVEKVFDFILHFASPASPNPNSEFGYPNLPIETIRANSWGAYNCLELARKTKAKFLMASTSEIYGDPDMSPQSEEYCGNVDSIGLRSSYDESKRLAEAITMAYHRHYGVDTRIVRIFNTYGPRMRPDDGRAVPNFIMQALSGKTITVYGTGEQTRSFCYIDDLVEGICLLMDSEIHSPINIGNPLETSIIDLAKMISKLTGHGYGIISLPKARFGRDPEKRCPDIRKANELLGWQPWTELRVGLEKTIQYYEKSIK